MAVAGGLYYGTQFQRGSALVDPPAVVPATAPAADPPAAVEPPRDYMAVVLAAHPEFPTTQPLGIPVDLAQAARIVLQHPAYVCSRRDLWVTHPDAPEARMMLVKAADEQTHALRETVAYIHWAPDIAGTWHPQVVATRDDGGFDLISPTRRIDLGRRRYDWRRAYSWNSAMVVPTANGAAVIEPDGEPIVREIELIDLAADDDGTDSPPAQAILDTRGVLAWIPWDNGQTGSEGAARYIDGQWSRLGHEQNWPRSILQLIPLLDGSILQLVLDEAGSPLVQMNLLDHEDLDERQIEALVDDLAHPDPERRERAYRELTRYGPGLWPILEKLLEHQPPEAQLRMNELLRGKNTPRLGPMTLIPGKPLQTIARLRDGGGVFYADAGVSLPDGPQHMRVVSPAFISIRPGRAVQLLPQALVQEFVPGRSRLVAEGDEWLLVDDVHGPQRFQGNHLQPLLRDDLVRYTELRGIDRRGRWVFHDPASPAQTLIIDRTLPDPTPRLPVWLYPVRGGNVGWTDEGWPAVERGDAWVLLEKGWRPIDKEKGEQMLTEIPLLDESSDTPLLTTHAGTRYFGGYEDLRVVDPTGSETVWPLPQHAHGEGPVWLIEAGDDRLFLFNQPGRMLRIRPTPADAAPFKLEAVFTRGIPNDEPARIWRDPANRIIIADEEILYILFPTGLIPPEMSKLMIQYEEGLPE